MPNYKTKEEYWRAQGRYALAGLLPPEEQAQSPPAEQKKAPA